MDEPEGLIDKAEVARRLGVRESTVSRWRRLGQIKAVPLGPKTYRYKPSDVEDIRDQGIPDPKPDEPEDS